MKKLHLLAIFALLAAVPVAFTSCDSNDEPPMVEESGVKLNEWIEPCARLGASFDEVKTYMSEKMTRYKLVEEQHFSFGGGYMVYATEGENSISILYTITGDGLRSIALDEYGINRDVVYKVLDSKYTLYLKPEEANGAYYFMPDSRDMIIRMHMDSSNRVNVVYSQRG